MRTVALSRRVVLVLAILGAVEGVRKLSIVSPLQTLTIWDPEVKQQAQSTGGLSFRQRFLSRFKAGLQAETEMRKKIATTPQAALTASDVSSKDWVNKATKSKTSRDIDVDDLLEHAYDEAVAKVERSQSANRMNVPPKNPNAYQFVGVVNPSPNEPPIRWYARKKPPSAKWSLRLVHVNKEAVLKDLFNRGKIDIYASYENTGQVNEKTRQPIIKTKYIVKERSWKNMWNFSPKNFFTDSSGMYWRERRVRPGLYTDGNAVYESSYRYRDGRNGMHRLSSLQEYLNSRSIDPSKKDTIKKRLVSDVPDIVLED